MASEPVYSERPAKRARLLSDESSSDESDAESTGGFGQQNGAALSINQDFAKRFEHNKKREELHKLQEKYGSNKTNYQERSRDNNSESESDSESEDDEGELVTQDLDTEIFDTLNAIRSKDPRVYDKSITFYSTRPDEPTATEDVKLKKEQKPIHLKDYHRQNLLGEDQDEDGGVPVPTYAEEQASMKEELVRQMHDIQDESEPESDQNDFFTAKEAKKPQTRKESVILEADIQEADKDPETFLNKFMSSRAWVPTEESRFKPFESDDDEDDQRADAFEEAYNLRFEDPQKANEKLISHSREAAAKYSVRRDDPKGRKRAREREREAKDAARLEREEEKARLRKLKIEEAQAKLERFKEAAGLKGEAVPVEKWAKFIDSGWDSEKWDREMAKRFGDHYYEEDNNHEESVDDETAENTTKKNRKVKKPKWDDDIDIADIVPDFDEEEKRAARAFKLSDDEDGQDSEVEMAMNEEGDEANRRSDAKSQRKEAEKERAEKKRQARKERQRIEELVDQSIAADMLPRSSSKQDGLFRYRDTSPTSFGLSARDILMADDSHLNQFAGLKKLAPYRDTESKKKDKKRLTKKARLREWRKEAFGDENGPRIPFNEYFGSGQQLDSPKGPMSNIIDSGPSKKKRRSRKRQITQGIS